MVDECVTPPQLAVDLLTGPGRDPSEGEELLLWMKGTKVPGDFDELYVRARTHCSMPQKPWRRTSPHSACLRVRPRPQSAAQVVGDRLDPGAMFTSGRNVVG